MGIHFTSFTFEVGLGTVKLKCFKLSLFLEIR